MSVEEIKMIFKEIFLDKPEIMVVYLYGSILKNENFEDIDIGLVLDNEFIDEPLYEAKLAGKLEKIF